MSKFKPGDRVRVVAVTNEHGEAVSDPTHPDTIDWHGKSLIGLVGVVTEVFTNGELDAEVRFDHFTADDPRPAFPAADLELVECNES